MDVRRLRAGEWIIALSGAALLVSLLLPWYSHEGEDRSGFEALAANDVILALIAASAVALFLITATQRVPAVPVALESLLALLGFVATILVLVRTAWPPDQREWGLWLALAGAVGIAVGGWIAIRDERLSEAGRHTDATGRPGPPPPEVESLPAPRP